jgi:hypothetical protein
VLFGGGGRVTDAEGRLLLKVALALEALVLVLAMVLGWGWLR